MWRLLFSFCFLQLVSLFSFGQEIHQDFKIDCETNVYLLEAYQDSLSFYEKEFGGKKKINIRDKKLKLAFYVALRHYPELKDVHMKVDLKKISATMMAQPTYGFIFHRKENRHYQIFVNSTQANNGMYYKDLTFNSQVGWIGHELAHILDYSQKNNRQLLAFITRYASSKRELKKTECEADKTAIRHGLGKQLLEGVNYFYHNNRVSKAYREKKKSYYLSPEQIETEMVLNCK
ncbi:MAG: hypothetical protein EBQ94_05130 [Flavobacteriales bacterium]|jgi:hypothetical protein|nr:hypothetical protein [Flavobacteriales bacterium]